MRLIPAVTLAVSVVAWAGAASAQAVMNTDQLESLRGELSLTANSIRDNLAATTQSIQGLFEDGVSDKQQAMLTILQGMEQESQTILDQVKLNSPFMNELDRARAEVLVILRKQEREPASPARDNRVARLEAALAKVEEEYSSLQNVESQIIFSLSQHASLRREIQLEGDVEKVERFVSDLGELTANLERMVAVLDEVGASVLQTDAAAVMQE